MVKYEELLEAGVHFGHLSRKWHPAMAPYIFMERNRIHIIDLLKTQKMLEEACKVVRQISRANKKVMFVGTKKQAQEIIAEIAKSVNAPYVTHRWLGGMLTNFATIKKSVRKLQQIEKMETDGTFEKIQKKERMMKLREKEALLKVLGGVMDMGKMPGALFIVDIKKEHIAVAEAKKLGIPTIGLVDTNSNPNIVDYPIPGNDDAAKSIYVIANAIANAIKEGSSDNRKPEKELEPVRSKEDELITETTTVSEVVQEA